MTAKTDNQLLEFMLAQGKMTKDELAKQMAEEKSKVLPTKEVKVKMTLAELKEKCKEAGLNTIGKKDELSIRYGSYLAQKALEDLKEEPKKKDGPTYDFIDSKEFSEMTIHELRVCAELWALDYQDLTKKQILKLLLDAEKEVMGNVEVFNDTTEMTQEEEEAMAEMEEDKIIWSE